MNTIIYYAPSTRQSTKNIGNKNHILSQYTAAAWSATQITNKTLWGHYKNAMCLYKVLTDPPKLNKRVL